MSILGSLVKPQSGKAVSTIATRSMTGCAQTVRQPRKQRSRSFPNELYHATRSVPFDISCIERLFIRSLVAASSCAQHRHATFTRPKTTVSSSPCRANQTQNCPSTARHFSTVPRRREHPKASQAIDRANSHNKNESRPPDKSQERDGEDPDGEQSAASKITKEEYNELVNTYPGFKGKRRAADTKSKSHAGGEHHYRLAPRLLMTPEQEAEADAKDRARSSEARQFDDATKQCIEHINRIVKKPLGRINLTRLWNLYESLPSPRPSCLRQITVNRMFRHMAWVEFKSGPNAMTRYMTLIDECLADNVPLHAAIWDTAISFSARWVRRVTSVEVKAAVEMWMRMEHFGFPASHVTFNILFDAAVRAERFALADTIYSELVTRKMPMNRYLRTSVIYYAGKQGSGDAVRSAFRDLVNAGDIVDTSVMNCVMLSLIRASEGPAAENVFARMKLLHEQKFGTAAPQSWQAQKELAHFLDSTAAKLRKEREEFQQSFFGTPFSNDDKKEAVQNAAPLAPNARTYRILITYHCQTTGDIGRIRELIAEMQAAELHVHGSVYYFFFRGFVQHGGFPRAVWSRGALEDTWAECLSAMTTDGKDDLTQAGADQTAKDISGRQEPSRKHAAEAILEEESDDDHFGLAEDERPPYFTSALAHIVIKAFYRCAGINRMLEVHGQILALWEDISPDQREDMQSLVNRFLREQGKYV